MTNYQSFIQQKTNRLRAQHGSISVDSGNLHPYMHGFQRDITSRALSMGRAALFEDCGMGKTVQSLEWAGYVMAKTGKPVPDLYSVGGRSSNGH